MRKGILIILAVMAIGLIGTTISEAGYYDATYVNGDYLAILSSSSWDLYNHVVITFNNQDGTASATVLDPYGRPVPADFGYYYFWADFYPGYFDFYGSIDGEHWIFLGSYY